MESMFFMHNQQLNERKTFLALVGVHGVHGVASVAEP